MARALGIDVSHYQGTINWSSVAAAGKTFAFQKATESTTYTDPTLATNMTGGTSAGVLMGVYHFARPDTSANDAANEASYFVSVAGKYMTSGWLHPVLDLEAGSALGKTVLSQWVNSFCATGEEPDGHRPAHLLQHQLRSQLLRFERERPRPVDRQLVDQLRRPHNDGLAADRRVGVGRTGVGFLAIRRQRHRAGHLRRCDLDTYTSDLPALKTNFLIGYTPLPATGTVSGKVFQDTNGNGQLTSGEPYVAGRTVYVDANNNGSKDAGELSTLTSSTGTYTFSLAPGAYTIRESGSVRLVPDCPRQ